MKTLKRFILAVLLGCASPAFSADYYTASGDPVTGSALSSSILRAEYAAIALGFTKIAPYTSANNRLLFVNSGATAQTTDSALTFNATTDVLTVNTSTFGLNTSIAGTLGVTGVATLTAQPILSSLTASLPVFSDGSKGLVSNAMTGTGNVMMSASPTTTGTLTAAAITASGAITANAGLVVGASQAITGTVANSTISGFLSVAATTGTFTNVGGTLSTAAQPNVTSLGTLTGLAITNTTGNSISITGSNLSPRIQLANTITISGADRRNWGIGTEVHDAGDFVIMYSTAAGGDPFSGSDALRISKTGAASFAGTLGVSSDFAVATSKFTVAAATGNTLVGGDLTLNTAESKIIAGTTTGTALFGNSTSASYMLVFGATNAVLPNHISLVAAGGVDVQGALSLNSNYLEGFEQTAPAAGAANSYRIFAQDNGAGKTQLMVIFASGAAQQIAIQP